MAHRTVDAPATREEVVQGSRFIALVEEVAGPDEAASHLARAKAEHPDATHHCWAYRVGGQQRFSDDGEPAGTAGRPMLEVLLKRGLDHVSAVVVRYFGGKKLGAGGLVRAYSGSLAKALDLAGTREVLDTVSLRLRAPFAQTDLLLRSLAALSRTYAPLERDDPEFDGDGVSLRVLVPAPHLEALERELIQATHGAVSFDPSSD